MSKNVSKSLSGKSNQKLLNHAKQLTTNIAEANGNLIGNKIPDKITLDSKKLPQNNSEIVKNIKKKIYISRRYRKIYISRRKTEKYLWSNMNRTI